MPEKRCIDFDKEDLFEDSYAVKLFHATVDTGSVCQKGLLPRAESGNQGLGGGTDNLVSFTTSPSLAKRIAKDLQTVIRIANGNVTPANICNYLEKHDASPNINASPCAIWEDLEKDRVKEDEMRSNVAIEINYGSTSKLAEQLDMLRNGYARVRENSRTMEEWQQKYPGKQIIRISVIRERFSDVLDDVRKLEAFKESLARMVAGEFTSPKFELAYVNDEKKVRRALLDVYRNIYLTRRHELGGPVDPGFYGTDPTKFEGLNPANVGIVEVEGFLPISPEGAKKMDLQKLQSIANIREGVDFMVGMDEIRLAKNRFHKLRVRGDLMDGG